MHPKPEVVQAGEANDRPSTLLEWCRAASCSEIARMDEWAGDERDRARAVECEE